MTKILGYELGTVCVDHGPDFTNAIVKIATMRHNNKKLDLRDPVVCVCYEEGGCFVEVELQKRKIQVFFNCSINVKRTGPEITLRIDNENVLKLHAQLDSLRFRGEKISLRDKKTFHYHRESAVDVCSLDLVLAKRQLRIPFRSHIEFHLHQVVEAKKDQKFPDAKGVAYNYLDAYFLQDMDVIAMHPVTGKPWPPITISREQAQKLKDDRLAQLEAQWQKDCNCEENE